MNNLEKGVLVGMILGDGCIVRRKRYDESRPNSYSYVLKITHTRRHLSYLEWKAQRLQGIFGGQCAIGFHEVKLKGKIYQQCGLQKSDKSLKFFRDRLYPNGKRQLTPEIVEMLTPEGMAIWYQDDGCLDVDRRIMIDGKRLKSPVGRVCSVAAQLAVCRPRQECELVRGWLTKNGVESKIQDVKDRNYSLIRFNTGGTKQLINLVAPFIHSSMQYKVDPSLHKDTSAVDSQNIASQEIV